MSPTVFARARSGGASRTARRASGHASGLAARLVLVLVVALQFGPAIGIVGYRLTQAYPWALAGGVRDLIVITLLPLAALAAFSAGRRQAAPASVRWALGMALAYAVLGLFSSSGLLVLALNLRRLVLVPLLYAALLTIPWSRRQIDAILALIVGTSVVVMLLGLSERFAPDALWTDWLDIDAYNLANSLDRFGSLSFQDSGRFFSWDLEAWTGRPLRRMVSSYLEPTTLAAAMSVATVMALHRRANGQRAGWLLAGALVCGVLTLSKGYVLFLGLLLSWGWWRWPSPAQMLPIAAVLAAGAWVLAAQGLTEGPFAHLLGVSSSLHYLVEGHWLGEGIGGAGNYTASDNDTGGESGLGNAIGQAGVAAVLQLLWVRAVAVEVIARARARRDRGGHWIAAWLLFWLTSYLLSASSLGVGGNALGFALLALYLHPAYRAIRR